MKIFIIIVLLGVVSARRPRRLNGESRKPASFSFTDSFDPKFCPGLQRCPFPAPFTSRPKSTVEYKTGRKSFKKIEFFSCGLNYKSALATCVTRGGSLWEPTSLDEYDYVFNNVDKSFLDKCFHFWIGFKNHDGRGSDAYHLSNPLKKAFWSLTESNEGEHCVDIFCERCWGDHPCNYVLPFICESKHKKLWPF